MNVRVVAVFLNQDAAGAAMSELDDAGIRPEDMSVVMRSPETRDQGSRTNASDEIIEHPPGAVTLADSMKGGLIGGLIGLAALMIPGVGEVLAVGPLAAALGGAAIGAAGGSFVGAIRDMDVADEQAENYTASLDAGALLVAVETDDERVGVVEEILTDHEAIDIHRIEQGG